MLIDEFLRLGSSARAGERPRRDWRAILIVSALALGGLLVIVWAAALAYVFLRLVWLLI